MPASKARSPYSPRHLSLLTAGHAEVIRRALTGAPSDGRRERRLLESLTCLFSEGVTLPIPLLDEEVPILKVGTIIEMQEGLWLLLSGPRRRYWLRLDGSGSWLPERAPSAAGGALMVFDPDGQGQIDY